MHTLSLNDIRFNLPGNWNELNRDQLLKFASLNGKKDIELEEIKIKMLFLFTGMKVMEKPSITIDGKEYFWLKYQKDKFLVSAYSLAFITQLNLAFFKEIGENKYTINPLLTRNLLTVIEVAGKKLYGPADGLSNLLLKEYVHTETFYSEYMKTQNQEALDKLIAILYRPAGKIKPGTINFQGDIREPFNDFLIDNYAKITKKLAQNVRLTIIWYYEGCKRHISALFPKVFKENDGKSSNENTFMNFMTIIDELANNQPAENERIMNVYLYTALTSLNQKIAKLPKNAKV